MSKEVYRLHSIYDTETSNLELNDEHKAICILYIFNDVSRCDFYTYEPDSLQETVTFLRDENSALDHIEEVIKDGLQGGYVPVIAAYNLMFDMQTLMYALNSRYQIKALAQSSTHVYTLDLYDRDGKKVLRFWDTYYLEMNGLAAMGSTCGFAKATGSWDYDLIRTPQTPLTELELFYAKRDVQVIPAYLRYILESNPHLTPEMLGSNVLTKTGLVRHMAKSEIGGLTYTNRRGRKVKLRYAFERTCAQEAPKDYVSYAIRKACFRGGWTFTAAATASKVVENVASLDVTSMHHTFINGRYIPVHFKKKHLLALKNYMQAIEATTLDYVLSHYAKPFLHSFHILVRFTNIRLKEGSVFARSHIALCPESKFKKKCSDDRDITRSEHGKAAEEAIRDLGYYDRASKAVFAFGKLYSAQSAELFLNEIEYWTMCQVYEWDAAEPIEGEGTIKFAKPPDYVVAQSHTLYKRKNAMKQLLKIYQNGVALDCVPDGIPESIANQCKDGSADRAFLEAYYNSTVKGQFNGIYGTQAQDVYKPDYVVLNGAISVDHETTISPPNWDERQPDKQTVLYTYGMRIVAGSRMHLVIACLLLDERFKKRIDILGGDTDSLKIRCNRNVTDKGLQKALEPLAKASKMAIDRVSSRLRETLPDHASDLEGVGSFEVESCGATTRYVKHMELWNKARVSLDSSGQVHVTCAGLSRPAHAYNVEDFIEDVSRETSFDYAATQTLGYNVKVANEVSHMLQRTHPAPWDVVDGEITDYLGNTSHIHAPEAICLYPESRVLGETDKLSNLENVDYLQRRFKRDVLITERRIGLIESKPFISSMTEWGEEFETY